MKTILHGFATGFVAQDIGYYFGGDNWYVLGLTIALYGVLVGLTVELMRILRS